MYKPNQNWALPTNNFVQLIQLTQLFQLILEVNISSNSSFN